MKKDNKKTVITLISIIVVLSITCVISIIYNLLGGFYFGRIVKYNAMLGEDLILKVEENGVSTISCNFSGTLVLGENFKQNVYIDVGAMDASSYIRAKAFISGININIDMSGITNWVKANDGYYYFNQEVNSYDKIQLCNNLIFKTNMNLDGYKDYIITFIVQASENEWAYNIN